MVTYQQCSMASIPEMFAAFSDAFADYILPMKMDLACFAAHMLRQEGNDPAHSFLACEDGKPVGVILGSIRIYEGICTMRCGALGVIPACRGKGVAAKLLELHRNEAVFYGCKQLVLEVINGNEPAEKFYLKNGYEKYKKLQYYKLSDPLQAKIPPGFAIRLLSRGQFLRVVESLGNGSVDWQTQTQYLSDTQPMVLLQARFQEQLCGVVACSPNGKLCFLWVAPERRNRGVASALCAAASHELALQEMSVSVLENLPLEGFLAHRGFQKMSLEQTMMKAFLSYQNVI